MFSLRDPHDVRQLARAPRARVSSSPTQITFSWLAFWSLTCLAGFFAGHHSQRTPRCHRRAGPEQKLRIIGHVRIEYNKECALKWQVPKGEIFVFPKFEENRSIISGDMTRLNNDRVLLTFEGWKHERFLPGGMVIILLYPTLLTVRQCEENTSMVADYHTG